MRNFKDTFFSGNIMAGVSLLLALLTFSACDTSEPDEASREAWDIWQADFFGKWVVDDYWGELVKEEIKKDETSFVAKTVAYKLHAGEGKIAKDTLVMRENNRLLLRKAKNGDMHLLDGYTPKVYTSDYSAYTYYDYKVYTKVPVADLSDNKTIEGASSVEFYPYSEKASVLSFVIFNADFLKDNNPYGYMLYMKADGYLYLYQEGLPVYRMKKISDNVN